MPDKNENLPRSIRDYFSGKNARDFDHAASAFAPSATVRDEGHEHAGRGAIREWIAATAAKYDDTAKIESVAANDSKVEVIAQVFGKFPGSPVRLRFNFLLDADLISRLEIGS